MHAHGPFFASSFSRSLLFCLLPFFFFLLLPCTHAASPRACKLCSRTRPALCIFFLPLALNCSRASPRSAHARWSFCTQRFFLPLLSPSSLLRRSFRASNQLVLVICNTNAFIRKQHFHNFFPFSSVPVNGQRPRRFARTVRSAAALALRMYVQAAHTIHRWIT